MTDKNLENTDIRSIVHNLQKQSLCKIVEILNTFPCECQHKKRLHEAIQRKNHIGAKQKRLKILLIFLAMVLIGLCILVLRVRKYSLARIYGSGIPLQAF